MAKRNASKSNPRLIDRGDFYQYGRYSLELSGPAMGTYYVEIRGPDGYHESTTGLSEEEALRSAVQMVDELARDTNPKRCPPGKVAIDRKGYTRKAYTDKRGRKVKATKVPRSEFCAPDQGRPGKTSFGAESGPRKGTRPLITKERKLGGPGYAKKSAAERHRLLERCVQRDGYRSCLGRLQVMLLSTELKPATRKTLGADKEWLKKKHGGPGSFGPRRKRGRSKNPEVYYAQIIGVMEAEGILVQLDEEELAALEELAQEEQSMSSNPHGGDWRLTIGSKRGIESTSDWPTKAQAEEVGEETIDGMGAAGFRDAWYEVKYVGAGKKSVNYHENPEQVARRLAAGQTR